jgi:hypothetical protein
VTAIFIVGQEPSPSVISHIQFVPDSFTNIPRGMLGAASAHVAMKLFDVAFSLVWVAVATAHGGIYTYNIPARYVKVNIPSLSLLSPLLTSIEPGSIFGTMDLSTVTKVMGFRTGSAASNGAGPSRQYTISTPGT